MAFVRLMCKAAELDNRRLELYQEKQFAVQKLKSEAKQKKSLKLRYRHCWLDCMRRIRKFFRRHFTFPEKSRIFRCCYKMRHEGSCENYTLKSVIGFIGGFLITYVFFMFFVFQLNFKFSTATIMCSIFGSILTIGLAFSYKVRCVVFLTLPQLFSKRGRQALLAYAFILAITGPAKNTLNNMGILSESLACGQEQLKAAVKQILEVIKKPFYAIRDAIKAVVKVVKIVVKKIKEILLAIKRVIMAIVAVIKSVFEFLAKIINVCNKELGTPFQRCTRVFESAITDCHAKLGPVFSWLCSITYLAQSVCYIVKIFDYVCMLVDFISNSIIGVIVKKIRIFVRHIKTMFYVRIKFSHSFHFETNASKSLEDVATGIVTEIKERTEGLMKVFDFMSCATSLFFMFIIFRVLYYRYKFLSDERFDNRFITKDFRAIDMRRAQLGKETVLPLNQRERNMYISVGSCRLVKKEKLQLSQSAMVLGTASLKLATHMMADYALYWVLLQIRRHGSFQSTFTGSNIPTLHVKGEGFLADLLRSIVKAFQPVGLNLEIDTIPCLPDPIPPDYDRYVQIASLLVICWFLMLFEPFGLRWRHSVMCFYHPHRAKERSIWLYNHILRTRSSFLKFARRQLRRKFKGDPNIAKITCKEFVKANLLQYRLCRLCLSQDKQMYCLLCGEVFREGDATKPIRCQTPNCPGIYCEKCFQDLQNLCTVCLDPIQYGDLSDISEEKDSSDLESGRTVPGKESSSEDETVQGRKKKKKLKLMWCCKKKRPPTADESDDSDTERLLGTKSPTTLSTPPTTDSDYYSTDTDLSYSYQYRKDVTEKAVEPPRRIFVDIEKQRYPDYASMDTFRKSSPEGQTMVKSKESESSEPQFEYDEEFDIPLLDLRSITDQSATTSSETSDKETNKPTVIVGRDQPKPTKRGYLFRRKFWKKKKKAAEKTGETPSFKDVSTSTETLPSDEETVSEPASDTDFSRGEEVSPETSTETSAKTSSREGDSETKLLSQPSEGATTTTPSTAETASLLPKESTSEVPITPKKKLKSIFAKKKRRPLKRKVTLKEATTREAHLSRDAKKVKRGTKRPRHKEKISTETATATETPITEETEKVKLVSRKPSAKEDTSQETTTTLTPLIEGTDNKRATQESASEEDISEETTTTTKTSTSKESLSEEDVSEETTASSIEEFEEIKKFLPKQEISEETTTTTATTETPFAEDQNDKGVTKEILPKTSEETTTTETSVKTKRKGILKRGKVYFDESTTTEIVSTGELTEKPLFKRNFMQRFLGRRKSPKSPHKRAQKTSGKTRKDIIKEKVSESVQTEDTRSSPERITKRDQKEQEHDVDETKEKTETKKTKHPRKSLRRQTGKLNIFAEMPEEDEEEILRKKKKKKRRHRKKTNKKTQTETKPQITHVAQLCAEILKRRSQRERKMTSTEIYCMNEICPVKLKRGKVPKLNLGVSPREGKRVKKPCYSSTSSPTSFASSFAESDSSSVASKTSLSIPSKKREKVKKKAKSKRRALHRELSQLDLSFAHQNQESYQRKYDVYYFTESETTPRSNKESVRSVIFSPVPKSKRPKNNLFNVSPEATSSTTTSSSATSVTILTSPNSQTVKSQSPTIQGSPHYTVNYLYSDDFKESGHENVIRRKNRRPEMNSLDSPGNTTETEVNANSYKNKARNYYNKLKAKPIDNPPAPGDHQSKFGQFIRRLLRKKNSASAASKQGKPKFDSSESESYSSPTQRGEAHRSSKSSKRRNRGPSTSTNVFFNFLMGAGLATEKNQHASQIEDEPFVFVNALDRFGLYDSTDTEISELRYPVKERVSYPKVTIKEPVSHPKEIKKEVSREDHKKPSKGLHEDQESTAISIEEKIVPGGIISPEEGSHVTEEEKSELSKEISIEERFASSSLNTESEASSTSKEGSNPSGESSSVSDKNTTSSQSTRRSEESAEPGYENIPEVDYRGDIKSQRKTAQKAESDQDIYYSPESSATKVLKQGHKETDATKLSTGPKTEEEVDYRGNIKSQRKTAHRAGSDQDIYQTPESSDTKVLKQGRKETDATKLSTGPKTEGEVGYRGNIKTQRKAAHKAGSDQDIYHTPESSATKVLKQGHKETDATKLSTGPKTKEDIKKFKRLDSLSKILEEELDSLDKKNLNIVPKVKEIQEATEEKQRAHQPSVGRLKESAKERLSQLLESQMSDDRRRSSQDRQNSRYSREPPERDQNYDDSLMKKNYPQSPEIHQGSKPWCTCKNTDDCRRLNHQQYPRKNYPEHRKRTTYDLVKSAENLRQQEQNKSSCTCSAKSKQGQQTKSSPEVSRNKQNMKSEDPCNADTCEYYSDYAGKNEGYAPNQMEHMKPRKYPYEEPLQDSDYNNENHDRNCSCDHCNRRNRYRNCKCCNCLRNDDHTSSYSDDSQCNLNLAYQKSEEYPDLVDEIENSISRRNKERVKKTMRQFEMLSRQNKGLEKPIYDDDEEDDNVNRFACNKRTCPVYNNRPRSREAQYYNNQKPRPPCCYDRRNYQTKSECLSERPAFNATPFPRTRGYVEKVARYMDPSMSDTAQKYPRYRPDYSNSRWQMDPRSGEWVKVCDDGYDFENNYPPLPAPPGPMYREGGAYRDYENYPKNQGNPNFFNTPNSYRTPGPFKRSSTPTKQCQCRNCMQPSNNCNNRY